MQLVSEVRTGGSAARSAAKSCECGVRGRGRRQVRLLGDGANDVNIVLLNGRALAGLCKDPGGGWVVVGWDGREQ
jgi:hypothetical protein